MPTEHEYKFVLRPCDIWFLFPNNSTFKATTIQQGYIKPLDLNLRIRKTNYHLETGKWFLTFKYKVKERLIEIEKEIDNRDGEDLWTETVCRIKKHRYSYELEGNTWEIDFFVDEANKVYFIMVEVELPEGSPRPEIPEFLKDFVIYEVDLTDQRFSNINLSDIEYAKNLYKLIERSEDE